MPEEVTGILTKYVRARMMPTPTTMGSAIATPFVDLDMSDSGCWGVAVGGALGTTPLAASPTGHGGGTASAWRGMCMVCVGC